MKITTTVTCALVALVINASASSAIQEANVHLQVRSSKHVEGNAAVKTFAGETVGSKKSVNFVTAAADEEDSVSESEDAAAAPPAKQHAKTIHTKAKDATMYYSLDICVQAEKEPWVKQLDYVCVVNDSIGGHSFYYRLSNGTYFSNCFCANYDEAGMDRVFQSSMGGKELTVKGYANVTCFSQHHAEYSPTKMANYTSELEYILDQFTDMEGATYCE